MADTSKKRTRPKTEEQKARQFGIVLFAGLCLIGGYLYWTERPAAAAYTAGAGVGLLFVTLVLKPLWLAFFKVWMKFAEALGWVMTRVILSLFYFLILTPTGLVLRMLGKRPLDMKWKDGKDSYWITKEQPENTVERYSRLY